MVIQQSRKRLRKLEKVDYCLQKAELDLDVLFRCRENVPPRFLNFKSLMSKIFPCLCTM